MSADQSPQAVLDEIATLARGDDLARLVHTVAFAAADEKRPRIEDGLAEVAERAGITAADAETSFGNVLRALERGSAEPAGSPTRVLLAALLARGVALSLPAGPEACTRVAEALVWLATHTSIDALPALDDALGDRADSLWLAVAGLIRAVDGGGAPLIGRAGALIAAASLRRSRAERAQTEAAALAAEVHDPIVQTLLTGGPTSAAEPGAGSPVGGPFSAGSPVGGPVTGEIVGAPRGPLALALLGLTGILALMHLGRFLAKVALRYHRPAELRVTSRGVTVTSRTELLGKTIRTQETHVPIEALLKASREIRYPRLAMYAGLIALALGSYFGVSLFVDGARAGSPELLGIGLLLVVVGVALDFALEIVASSTKGKCRVVIVPRKGQALAIGKVDPTSADLALRQLIKPAA